MTYDADGAYGHPDHIQAHRVAWRACELAGPDGPARLYATAAPVGAQVTAEIDAGAWLGRKLAAMRAHETQITVDPPFFALSDGVPRPRAASSTIPCWPAAVARPPRGRETDLFAR